MPETNCRHFNGYKPCGKSTNCERTKCSFYESTKYSVLIVHLEAMGAVLRSTSLLQAIHARYPRAVVTWVTKAPAHKLLENVEGIDRVLTLSVEDLLQLSALEFDVALVIDKSLAAAGVLKQTRVREVRGFRVDASHGVIVPANREAHELWEIGLNDHKKFFENKKTEQELVHKALALGPFARSGYRVELTSQEKTLAQERRRTWGNRLLIGMNTGCSETVPAKKLSVEGHRGLIARILEDERLSNASIVLLGGPEDTERNLEIARAFEGLGRLHLSPTQSGLRDGLVSVAACDLVFSGDSLGMHMAIGLKKWVVAWFGPTCEQEIDLYDRGVKILSQVSCSPCWRRVCHKPTMCYDRVDFDSVLNALVQGKKWLTSSFKQHSPETFSSPSHS